MSESVVFAFIIITYGLFRRQSIKQILNNNDCYRVANRTDAENTERGTLHVITAGAVLTTCTLSSYVGKPINLSLSFSFLFLSHIQLSVQKGMIVFCILYILYMCVCVYACARAHKVKDRLEVASAGY